LGVIQQAPDAVLYSACAGRSRFAASALIALFGESTTVLSTCVCDSFLLSAEPAAFKLAPHFGWEVLRFVQDSVILIVQVGSSLRSSYGRKLFS
jgi:hypothetical protein